jgi:hypothetical protein
MAAALSSIPPPMSALGSSDVALTLVLFKPDGGRAKTLRISAPRLLALCFAVAVTALAAMASGWILGEWTARL